MGTSSSSQTLQHLQTITDSHFGEVELYKTSQIAHLMKKTFTFVQRSHIYHKCLSNLKFMEETRHSSLVPVHRLVHKQQKHLCIQYDIIQAYVEYYNFTLKSIIEAGRKLTREEMWYILLELSDLAILLSENKIRFEFDIDNVFITLSGIPCIYLFDGVYDFSEGDCQQGFGNHKNKNVMAFSLANTILNLAGYDCSEDIQLKFLKSIDENLCFLIVKMKQSEIELEQIPAFVESLMLEKRIIVSKTLSVTTKFMNQLKKQNTQSITQSREKQKQRQKQKQKQRQKQKQKQREKQKFSLTLPSSNTVSLQLPPKFLEMEETLKGIDQKKKNNNEKQEMMKRRMEQMLCMSSKKAEEKPKGKQQSTRQKQNTTVKVSKGINSLSLSTVTSRQSLNNSQQIKPMRSSMLWRRKALELVKKEH